MLSAACESFWTGSVMRRDRYQASAPATTIPKKPASVSRSISVVHRSRSSAFGFAATSAP